MGYGGAKMKKITKKIISLAICAIMVFGTISVGGVIDFKAFAATSGSCGVYLTWSYNSDTNELVISGTGEMTSSPWDYYEDKITKVTIDDGVTNIGTGVFYRCTKLTSVTIGNSVTSIGDYAFRNCTGLTSITIPDSVKSIGDNAFENCTRLASITIPDSVTTIGDYAFRWTGYYSDEDNWQDGVLYIGNYLIEAKDTISGEYKIKDGTKVIADYAFYYCISLKSITIPDSVTSIGDDAFRGCTGLTSITIPDSVTSIGGGAFYGCTGLTSITIPNSVTSIGTGAFQNCTGLKSITIPDSVTSIGTYAFSGCTGLTSITIPNSVTSIGQSAFYGCTGLTSITIPDSVTSIGKRAFYGCTGLTSITIPDSVTSIGWSAFYGCTGLKTVYYTGTPTQWSKISIGSDNDYLISATRIYECNSENPYYVKGICGENVSWVLYTSGELVISGTGAMTDYEDWYNYRYKITKVTIEDGVTTIVNYAFKDCTGLTSITISNSVTRIGQYAFSGCTGLKSITIGNSVTSIGCDAFYGCKGLTSVTIPNSVTSIESYVFSGCTRLTEINVDNNNEKYCSIDGVLFSKDKTEIVCYPVGKTDTSYSIPDSVMSIAEEAFRDCKNLTSITIGNSVTSIGSCAFVGTGLTSVKIPSTVTSIGGRAFGYNEYAVNGFTIYCENGSEAQHYANFNKFTCILSSSGSNDSYYSKGSCGNGVDYILYANGELVINGSGAITSSPWDGYSDNIYKVTIGNGVTSICDEAFYNCQNLYKVTIGNGVRTIGSFAFCGTGLTEVTIPSTVTNIGIRAFSADYWTYKNWSLTIYCEEGSVAQQYAEKNEIYYVNVRDASTKDNSSSLSFFQRIIAFFKNIFNSIKNLFL